MMTQDEVVVTDHALCRWLERVKGIDMEGYRAQLAVIVGPAARTGASMWLADNHRYVLRNGTLITVSPAVGKRPK